MEHCGDTEPVERAFTMSLLTPEAFPCALRCRLQYSLQCVFDDGADDTLVINRPISTSHFELPLVVLHHPHLEQTVAALAAFKVSVLLPLQRGRDGFYCVFLLHILAVVGCCQPSKQSAISLP